MISIITFVLGFILGAYFYGAAVKRIMANLEVSALEWDQNILGYRVRPLPEKIREGTLLAVKTPIELVSDKKEKR